MFGLINQSQVSTHLVLAFNLSNPQSFPSTPMFLTFFLCCTISRHVDANILERQHPNYVFHLLATSCNIPGSKQRRRSWKRQTTPSQHVPHRHLSVVTQVPDFFFCRGGCAVECDTSFLQKGLMSVNVFSYGFDRVYLK